MKRWIFGFLVFAIATIFGTAVVLFVHERVAKFERYEAPVLKSIRTDPDRLPSLVTEIDAEFNPNINYAKSLKVKLLKTGSFHSDEVPYRSGEPWLGLYRGSGGFELASTTISVRRGPANEMFNTDVETKQKGESLFLIRGASSLVSGTVSTVHNSNDDPDNSHLQGNGNKRIYIFNEMTYVLRLENANEHGGPGKNSALVLESDGSLQILRYLPDGCNDCSWSVDWIGDLDRDGKLDFLLDLSGHYNAYNPTLLLSSSAKEGKLVGIFASFGGVGC